MWWDNKEIRILIEETADECEITPGQVLGVLSCVFNTIIEQANNPRVKLFRLKGIGTICEKYYKSITSRSHKDGYINKKNAAVMEARRVAAEQVAQSTSSFKGETQIT